MKRKEIPEVKESRKIQLLTSIWIVPIVALIIALWLAYQYFSKLGPEIEIAFESSGGLSAGESQVKMRDVPVGVVKKIELREGKKGVVVTVRFNKDAEPYLNENTKFWIAKPKIDTKGVSGLDTLMSGSYIAMYGKRGKGEYKRLYIGLEEPYIDKDAVPGKRYHLSAPDSRDLSVGADVYYRKIAVGTLESVKLSKGGDRVDFTVFIKEPYTKFVTSQTQFWKVNNVNLDFVGGSLKLDIAPLSSILNGAIAFSTSTKSIRHKALDENYTFVLYADYSEARQKEIGLGGEHMRAFQFHFDESIGNLEIGAPIEFYGFEVGHVVNIESDFDKESDRIDSVVIGLIDMSAFVDPDDKNASGFDNLKRAVQNGLKARLSISNPLTGTLYIELVKDKEGAPAFITTANSIATFPTTTSNFDGIMDKLASMVDKVNSLELNTTVDSVNKMIGHIDSKTSLVLDKLSKSLDAINEIVASKDMKRLPSRISASLKSLESSLNALNALLAGDSSSSLLSARIKEVLEDIDEMSKSVSKLSKKLEKKPNSLIFGE